MERMITRTAGQLSRMSQVASMPFSSGMVMSMSTTSGCSAWARLTASRPLPTVPTTAISPSACKMKLKPSRTTA
jgi:hypothetical protein